MPAKLLKYYDDDWRAQTIPCLQCGWSGAPVEMVSQLYDQLTDFACPVCDQILLILAHPMRDEIERAAHRGVEEAMQHLALIQQAGASQGSENA